MPARRAVAFLLVVLVSTAAVAQPQQREGIELRDPSALRSLVPADELERAAGMQYAQLLQQAAKQGALAPPDHPQVKRLRAIAGQLIPFGPPFNPRAKQWKWEVNLIGSKQINAFCMPGGKIAFFTGILDTLKLTDDEVAAVMGHEVAHALREHARERIAKNELTQIGAAVLGQLIGRGRYADAIQSGGNLLTLKFSRDDETEADVVGLELAARAGFDPRAAVSLWKKMGAASKGGPPQWLSTHPSGPSRIREIEKELPAVVPLFAKARQSQGWAPPR